MPKRQTKADVILSEARQRITEAEFRVRIIQEDLSGATAALQAHKDSYDALEKQLAPKPRKKASRPAEAAQKELPAGAMICGTCGNAEDYQDHFKPSPNYHAFESGKAKLTAVGK